MKQDEKGGKRSADGVGESKHAGRLSGRATGDYPCAPTSELIQGFPCHPRTLHWLGRLIRSIVGLTLAVNLGRWGLWAGLAVPSFPHHPTIERSAFDEKNYRPIFHHA